MVNFVRAFFLLTLVGCASIPGKSGHEQAVTVDELIQKTKVDLKAQSPQSEEEITRSVGYVVMNNKLTKIPVVGVGSGYGVAIDNKTGGKTYLRLRRFDIGAGWGARSVRPVLVFQDEKVFRHFIDGILTLKMNTEASAKVGEVGAAGSAGAGHSSPNKTGYTSYLLTDAGVSATASLALIRVKPVRLKK